jgi:hypothetical protein
MNQRRYHPPNRIAEHPMIKQAFQVMGAILIATKAKDLEADFVMSDESGTSSHQFHVEITEVERKDESTTLPH